MQLNRVVVAPQGFKGGINGVQVANALAVGVKQALPTAEVVQCPLADGGNGTMDVFARAWDGAIKRTTATGPLGQPVRAQWVSFKDKTALIEMAQTSGLAVIPHHQRDARRTTTRGTGELIIKALEAGCQKIIVGVGGSATNDGGAGLLQALGVRLLNAAGSDIGNGGAQLSNLDKIDIGGIDSRIGGVEVVAVCDVSNPLLGNDGATAVYGPQKGADKHAVVQLESALSNFARIVRRDTGKWVANLQYGGAAGGTAAGLSAFLNAKLVPGADYVLDIVRFDELLEDADLLITAEGCLDNSSAYNKCPVVAARRAKRKGVRTVAIGGVLGAGWETLHEHGLDAIFCMSDGPMTINQSKYNAQQLLSATAREVCLLLLKP